MHKCDTSQEEATAPSSVEKCSVTLKLGLCPAAVVHEPKNTQKVPRYSFMEQAGNALRELQVTQMIHGLSPVWLKVNEDK